MDNEEQEIEKEVLSSIYPTEFSVLSTGEWIFQVIETPGSCRIKMVIRLPYGYPAECPPEISLYSLDASFPPSTLSYLERCLQRSAKEKIGAAMLYDLMEELKQLMEQVETEIAAGEFSRIPEETCVMIFRGLGIRELGRLAQTCLQLHVFAEKDIIWQPFFLRQMGRSTGVTQDFKTGLKRLYTKQNVFFLHLEIVVLIGC
eukprot:TRINITY_DN4759_c0_g1_i11.p1 TRINITY_DN4759_c0_g1~~TRINITY_DN4759_c0_g1_i11.p1  ORF type:complete len:202 (+),score=32.31 TRINITY_DN4759_c0_g1_i11:552-1157(+)